MKEYFAFLFISCFVLWYVGRPGVNDFGDSLKIELNLMAWKLPSRPMFLYQAFMSEIVCSLQSSNASYNIWAEHQTPFSVIPKASADIYLVSSAKILLSEVGKYLSGT